MSALASRLVILDEALSTSDAVRAAAAERGLGVGDPPLWLAARRQTAGRGRRGRAWVGLEGNLFVSGWVALDVPPERAAELSFAAALAVGDLLDPVVGAEAITFKWPNDVLLAGAKVAGVLLEGAGPAEAGGQGLALVVGVGVNLAAAPISDAVGQAVTSVAAHARAPVPDVPTAAGRLAEAFETRMAAWTREGFEALRSPWLARCAHLGGRVRTLDGRTPREGVFEDVDAQGRLILRCGGERVRIHAGDVAPVGAPERASPARPDATEDPHASGH